MRRIPTTLALLLVALLGAGCGGAADSTGGGGGSPGEGTATEGGEAAAATSAADRLDEATLEDFGCGYGFTVGTADQTLRLSLWSDSGYGEPPSEGAHELGDTWTGQFVTGTDLFAQWCDDVIEPDEPEVVEEASWEVSGTLTWELVEGDGQCPSVATGSLTDGEVLTDSGSVPLPDVEFRNESFGCFAG